MALVINDRVKETTTTTGTGALSLGGAVTGFEAFSAGVGNSNTTYYAISHQTEDEWEVGLGTLDGDLQTVIVLLALVQEQKMFSVQCRLAN